MSSGKEREGDLSKSYLIYNLSTLEPKQIRLLLPKGTGASSSSLPAAGGTSGPAAKDKDTSKDKDKDSNNQAAAASSHHASSSVPDIQATLQALGVQNDGLFYMVFAIDDCRSMNSALLDINSAVAVLLFSE